MTTDLTAPCPRCGFHRDTPNHVHGCPPPDPRTPPTDDGRAAARARRDEARTVNATEPLRCRAALLRVIDDADALDSALDAVEKERDALKAAVEAVRALHQPKRDDPMSLIQHTFCSCGAMEVSIASDGYPAIGPAAYPCATLRALVSVEEGTGHE